MSRSDSQIDLAKYAPSLETRREILDEQAAQERLRKALDNPELDAALEEYRSESETLPNPPPAPAPLAPAMPSAWGARSADVATIDKALLPSANAPVAPPVTTPVEVDEPRRPARPWSMTQKGLAAIAFAFLPAMLVFMLFVKPTQQGTPYAPTSASVPAPPSATMAVSAAPVVSAAVPPPATSVEPSVAVDAGSGAAPTSTAPTPSVSTSTPSVPRPAPSLQHTVPAIGIQAPTPPAASVTATAPPAVTAIPTSAATAAQPPTPDHPPDAFLHKRPQ